MAESHDKHRSFTLDEQIEFWRGMVRDHRADVVARGDRFGEGTAMAEAILETLQRAKSAAPLVTDADLTEAQRMISLSYDMLKSCVATPFTQSERDLCREQLMKAFKLIGRQTPSSEPGIKPFGWYGMMSNGDGTESPHFEYGEKPWCLHSMKDAKPLYLCPSSAVSHVPYERLDDGLLDFAKELERENKRLTDALTEAAMACGHCSCGDRIRALRARLAR